MSKKDKEQEVFENKEVENVDGKEDSSNQELEKGESENEIAEKSAKEEWQEKYNQLNDKYLRLYSEFENFRKRTIKEKSDLILNGGKAVILDLLSILDDFERANANNEKSEDAASIKEGFDLIYIKLIKSLRDKGLEAMDCKGKPFDAEEHEAVANFPAPKKKDKGKIIDIAEKGYYLNDKVLRYAKVIVGQ